MQEQATPGGGFIHSYNHLLHVEFLQFIIQEDGYWRLSFFFFFEFLNLTAFCQLFGCTSPLEGVPTLGGANIWFFQIFQTTAWNWEIFRSWGAPLYIRQIHRRCHRRCSGSTPNPSCRKSWTRSCCLLTSIQLGLQELVRLHWKWP